MHLVVTCTNMLEILCRGSSDINLIFNSLLIFCRLCQEHSFQDLIIVFIFSRFQTAVNNEGPDLTEEAGRKRRTCRDGRAGRRRTCRTAHSFMNRMEPEMSQMEETFDLDGLDEKHAAFHIRWTRVFAWTRATGDDAARHCSPSCGGERYLTGEMKSCHHVGIWECQRPC